jgi:hypothetical protein
MRRASYKHAVQWIADNDSAGDDDALNPDAVAYLVTTLLVSDIFGVDEIKVGYDIVQQRKRNIK